MTAQDAFKKAAEIVRSRLGTKLGQGPSAWPLDLQLEMLLEVIAAEIDAQAKVADQ